ncbi:hypothetical protein KUTeg_002065 [Tegillarca granosa]|uniref:Uncharacterized protein n=1 Tax=Tegillarca granosa TaxID=220873 RepID=A0ABQ9FT94_TEGGR|nr:hypothetical protein KUTeg_002065 [Tegillarca granosa]
MDTTQSNTISIPVTNSGSVSQISPTVSRSSPTVVETVAQEHPSHDLEAVLAAAQLSALSAGQDKTSLSQSGCETTGKPQGQVQSVTDSLKNGTGNEASDRSLQSPTVSEVGSDDLNKSGGSVGGKSDISRHNSLQAVISHLITTQTAALLKDEEESSEKGGKDQGHTSPLLQSIKHSDISPKSHEALKINTISPNSLSPKSSSSSNNSPQTKGKSRSRTTSRSEALSGNSSPSGRSSSIHKSGERRSSGGSGSREIVSNRIPVNGNVVFGQASVSYDKFGALYYDYSLPDRGLGSAVSPAAVPRAQTVTPSGTVVGVVAPGWPYPQSPLQLPVPSPSQS